MKNVILFTCMIVFFSYGCEKHRAKKFEGDYLLESTINEGNSICFTEKINIVRNNDNTLSFEMFFGGYYYKTLTIKLESSKEGIIEPISSIGVMSQGGYELYGGKINRDKDKLTLELDVIHYSDPNDPFVDPSSSYYQRQTETYSYVKL